MKGPLFHQNYCFFIWYLGCHPIGPIRCEPPTCFHDSCTRCHQHPSHLYKKEKPQFDVLHHTVYSGGFIQSEKLLRDVTLATHRILADSPCVQTLPKLLWWRFSSVLFHGADNLSIKTVPSKIIAGKHYKRAFLGCLAQTRYTESIKDLHDTSAAEQHALNRAFSFCSSRNKVKWHSLLSAILPCSITFLADIR